VTVCGRRHGVLKNATLQASVGGRRPQKLSPLFYDPCRMLQKVGTVAYKVELPMEARICHVFHVSQLKSKLETATEVQHRVPTDSIEQILEPN